MSLDYVDLQNSSNERNRFEFGPNIWIHIARLNQLSSDYHDDQMSTSGIIVTDRNFLQQEWKKRLNLYLYDCLIKNYKIETTNIFDLDCSICFEQYKINNSIKILNCGHHFCTSCIDKWIEHNYYSNYYNNKSSSCPCCRQKILNNNIFNSGLTKLYFENNYLGEKLLKLINYKRTILGQFNIDKNYLKKIHQIEIITTNTNNINKFFIQIIVDHIYKMKIINTHKQIQYQNKIPYDKKLCSKKIIFNVFKYLIHNKIYYNKIYNNKKKFIDCKKLKRKINNFDKIYISLIRYYNN